MSFAFLGRIEGRLCLYSQLTGVVPGYQSQGLGYRIKIHQRDFARAEGIGLIAWAFDPLQAGNAHFNLARLGASAGRYVENMYGERTDALNAGVPTDRLIAEWDTAKESNPVDPPRRGDGLAPPHQHDRGAGGCIRPRRGPGGRHVSPTSTTGPASSSRSPPTSRGSGASGPSWPSGGVWPSGRRSSPPSTHGYRAVSFVRDETVTPRRVFYVLDRRPAP